MRPGGGARLAAAQTDRTALLEAQRDALRAEVDRLLTVIAYARTRTSFPDVLRALDVA